MKKHSGAEGDWDSLRNQIIGLGEESHGKSYYSALKKSRDGLLRFRGVIEEIPDLILILDTNDSILDMNHTAVRVFDCPRNQLLSRNINELSGIPYDQMIQQGPEYKVLRSDDFEGQAVIREMTLRTVTLEQRTFRVLLGRDITHRIKVEQDLLQINEKLEILVEERTASIEDKMKVLKETQEQLVLSEKMAGLGNLVAGVAHEINTPLGVGVTASSALVSEVQKVQDSVINETLTQRQFQEFLDYLNESARLIQSNLERAGDLIQSFKLVAVDQSSERGRIIDLKMYLKEVIHSLYPQWKKHSVLLEGDLNQSLFTVPGDWSQIITNLIMNSLKHGFREKKSGGQILIRIGKEGQWITVDYRDNGRGLTREQKEHIFEPFYTTSRSQGGTGLGMHIVFNLVTLKMKGTITILSLETTGAAFQIRIPLGDNLELSETS